jgi:iron(III) transport system ATP-binding protein
VHDTTLDIEPGTFVTLLGPSGCGKTTTLRMIAGFESPDEGEIYLGGEAINSLTPNKRDTAMVFQSYALLPHYNVFDNVAYGLKIRKLPKEEIRERVLNILKLVEMEGMESRMTNQLSVSSSVIPPIEILPGVCQPSFFCFNVTLFLSSKSPEFTAVSTSA